MAEWIIGIITRDYIGIHSPYSLLSARELLFLLVCRTYGDDAGGVVRIANFQSYILKRNPTTLKPRTLELPAKKNPRTQKAQNERSLTPSTLKPDFTP